MSTIEHMQRESDPNQLRIVREIPLWGLLGGLGAFLLQGVLMWHGQEKQVDATARMSSQLQEQSRQIQELAVQIGSKNLKDAEHDFKISDNDRRITAVELQVKTIEGELRGPPLPRR